VTDLHTEKPSVFLERQAANQPFEEKQFVGVFLVSTLIIYVLQGIFNWADAKNLQ
jgi:hypothetical protein